MTLEKAWRSKNTPLFLHGDGVEFQSRDSLLTFSFGALALGKAMTSLEANLYLAAFPKSSTHEKTWEPIIWKLLSWSFTTLGKGFQSEVGKKLTSKSACSLTPKILKDCRLGLQRWGGKAPAASSAACPQKALCLGKGA